jgi:rod shape determining protein RodA
MKIDLRSIRAFDWITFGLMLLLAAIGLLFIMSATYQVNKPYSIYFYKQLYGLASGLVLYFIILSIDYRTLQRWSYFLFIATICLLIFTLVKGKIAMGAGRWINLGFIKFQPSELTKLFFPGFFTYYLLTEEKPFRTFFDFLPILIILGFSSLLIRQQPDLGTALIILFSGTVLLWMAGLPKKFFYISILIIGITAPITWHLLKEYQRQRIMVFLGYGDARKERYHLEQSKIAVGSGSFLGKGFLQGTQNKLQFLPESRTDFIFSVIGEEMGFLGCMVIILLYIIFYFRILFTIALINHPIYQLLAVGFVIHLIFSTLVNMGMVIGLLPIVGIPLPLLSYGVTNVWITCMSLGALQGIISRRSSINTLKT